MKRNILIVCGIFLMSQLAVSQVKFKSKSGKEKAKVARKEAKEAKNDTAYQNLMTEGHELFSNNDFEGAIDKYESAATKRPINVYPRVKIADVRLAMLSYTPEAPKPDENLIAEIIPDEKKQDIKEEATEKPTQEERVKKALEIEEKKIKKDLPPPPKEPVVSTPKVVVPKVNAEKIEILTTEDFSLKLGAEYPEGVTEENWEEARKKMTRRVVVIDGMGNDYRRVVANYGTTYFKNDSPITKNTWDTETVLEP